MHQVSENLWTLRFPLRFFGLNIGRCVSIIRISEGRLVIHSTGPFLPEDIRKISELGEVILLLEGTTMHDTFALEGQSAFPNCPYLVPEGFPRKVPDTDQGAISEVDSLTENEIQTVKLEGMRILTEYACFHPASRTLIVCDLLFNLIESTGYTRWAMKYLMGVKEWPAIDRPVRAAVKDREAFARSLQKIYDWDFDRIIVGHGSIIDTDGKEQFRKAVKRAGYDLSPN